MPEEEEILQKLQEPALKKFLKYFAVQNYTSAVVEKVIELCKNGKLIELKEIKEYQDLVDSVKVDKKDKSTKELYEDEKKRNDDLEKRLQELESKSKVNEIVFTEDQRIILEMKAEELGITFNKKISSQKLLEKIQEKEFEFKL